MKTYYIAFFGRLVGSLGITYHNVVEIKADNKEGAMMELYKTHEHISQPHVSEWEEAAPPAQVTPGYVAEALPTP